MNKWQRVQYQPNTPVGADGERVTASKEHRTLSKEAAKEGMVLLKNEGNILPLAKGAKVALFGKGSFDYVKGGGGSGDVTVAYMTNLYEGMKGLDGQVEVFEALSDFYKSHVIHQYAKGALPGLTIEPEVSEDLIAKTKAFTNTAIITISRFSGEGWDRTTTVAVENESSFSWEDEFAMKAKMIFENGDFYLSNAEKAMVTMVKENFANIIVVLNVGGIVDTQWLANNSDIQSVLMAWQGGMEGGKATAELLCGIGNPSGKLVDTYAKNLEVYPSSSNFHESGNYVAYTEDIYVGYRYFETVREAADQVNYPFGYGLSYTTFEWSPKKTVEDSGVINIEIKVTNTGDMAGKEVIQVYVNAPQGLLGKATKSLVAFKKTRLLQSGETQRVYLELKVEDLASYDDLGKVQKSAYVLEAGDYKFYVGTSVREVKALDYVYSVEENRVIKQLSAKLVPTSLKERMKADGSYEQLAATEPNDPNTCIFDKMPPLETEGMAPGTVAREKYPLWPRKDDVKRPQLIEVVEGKLTLEEFITHLSDAEVAELLGGQPNTGVANTFGFGNLPQYGVPNIMTADGPAGLRINEECGVNTTAWPCSTLLACTWNEDLVYEVGEAGAKEVKENNIAVWLTPALNIHRSPLCGRNFEYYSEDPLISGKMAAAMVKGIQSQNIAATPKHFALNNKETNRKNSDSRVSERAAREIYLKGFEIVVKEADPWCLMSSYNIINGHRASENRELLEDILRGEWGYKGMVTTDWWTFGEHYKETKAGNDVKMACGFVERLAQAQAMGELSRSEMEISAKRVLELVMKID
jgi:beta-glucosidase